MDYLTNPIHELVASIHWKLMFTIIQGAVAFFIVLWIKNYIVALVAWLRFKNSLYMCLGTWVRLPTSDSYVDGQIQSANIRFIEIITKETRVYIPTKTFSDRDWVILKKDALLSHEDEMNQLGSVESPNISISDVAIKKENENS
jgi:hypothetical protein